MKRNNTSRTTILVGAMMVAFAVIIVRLFVLQIVENQKYKALANREQMKRFEIPAQRGLIYAMNGEKPTKLVMNETVYTLFVDPHEFNSSKKMKEKKAEVFATLREITGGNLVENFEKLFEKDNKYQVLGKKLNRKQAESIRAKKYVGIGFTPETQRVYPEGQLASQVLGFVNDNGGNYGIEAMFEKDLAGKDGLLKTTTDVFGNSLMIGDEDIAIPAQDGKNIVLSIDRNIQAKTEKVLQAQMSQKGIKNGSVLVMNPENGKVLAMANYPTFDPAKYGEVKDASVFNNNTTTMAYENGSVIKSLTMAMGINEGVASATGTYYNADVVKVEDRTIGNAVRGYTGMITFQTAMNYSLNTGMVEISKRLGGGSINRTARDKMYDYYHNRFGLGAESGIEIFENVGTVISPENVEGNAVRYSNMSFGQGMNTTMIQTATGFSAAINGGTLFKPMVVAGEISKKGEFLQKNPEVRNQNVVNAGTSEQLREILVRGRRHLGNSGDLAGYRVGGKTGTSETLVGGKYVKNQTIGSYLGFGGNNSPKYVIMVAVWGEGQNLQGHADAQPIFTEISNWMLNYSKIKPEGN